MRKFLLSLVFVITAISVQAQDPAVTITTQKSIGSTIFINIATTSNFKTIQFDWGNGTLESYSIGTSIVTASGVITSNTIKIYGSGIKTLVISSQEITSIDVANATSLTKLSIPTNKISDIDLTSNTALTYLECSSNNLSTLNVTANTLLTYLGCNNNNLTTIDISNNTALTSLQCSSNKITTLSLSNNTALQTLVCNKNLLSSLNITSNSALTTIDCSENELLLNTLPIPQALWTSYTYSPQNTLKLPQREYSAYKPVDLSSQYYTNGNNTTYTWKNKWEETLIENTDYTVKYGVVTFLKESSDSVYCEMTNLTFPNLTLKTSAIKVTAPVPNIVITTATAVGSSFSINIGAIATNTPIKVDWGNGVLTDHTIGMASDVSGTLVVDTIKIYGEGITMLNLNSRNLTSLDVTNSNTLAYLYCSSNQLTALDITKNTVLTSLYCSSNQLTALDVTKNTVLTHLNCSSNQLTALDVTKCTTLTELYCFRNNLTLATLPIKQATWTTYQYHSQAKLALAKSEYNLNEEIDLSSQLITGGNTTTYIWRSGGFELVKDVDYTESNGKFSFIKQPGDSTYCEMMNATFPDFSLTTKGISVALSNPILSLTTLTPAANQLTFFLKTSFLGNRKVNVDWGNGVLIEYAVGTNFTNITGTLAGNTIKVYGLGITHLDVTNIRINAIEVNSSTLYYVDCKYNNLSFSSLPLKKQNWLIYNYSPQDKIALAKSEFAINEEVDLSSQLTAGGNTTTYIWKTLGGKTLLKDVDYTENAGKFSFIKQPWDYVYCEMANATFPELTLITENVSISQTEPSITMTTATTIGSTFTVGLCAIVNDIPIKVDWGNGTLANYTVGTSYSNVSGTLAGNTIKIYGLGINYLYLQYQNLTSLDVTKSITLTKLICISNQLTTLDVSNNTALTYLSCNYNQLSTLDVTKNTALTNINCDYNQLTTLDVTNNTSLTSLDCGSNQLTALDVTQNIGLQSLECNNNKLTALDVTKNTELTYLDCGQNQLNALDVSKNIALTQLNCSSNKFKFSTLPIKQSTWTTYTYSSQAKIILPKTEYALNETIDLSSEFSIGGNNTSYVWKTIGGVTLIKNVDYNESNGKFIFLKNPGDYYYCEMTNAIFPDLTLTTENISITQAEPTITMTTTTTVGSTFSFEIRGTADNIPIKVDWGNGTLVNYTITTIPSNISGTLAGNTINIYGIGITSLHLSSKNLTALNVSESIALKYLRCYYNELTTLDVSKNIALQILDCSGNKLTTLDVSKNTLLTFLRCDYNQITTLDLSKNTKLTDLDCYSNLLSALDISNNTVLTKLQCYSNKLTFSSLPLQQPTWTDYSYSPQAKFTLLKTEYALNEEIDLSSQLSAGGNTTVYTWKTAGGVTLLKNVDYTENNGKFAFLKQPGDYLYCEMKNATFPDLMLISENISIAQTVPSITMNTTKTVGDTFSFLIKSTTENNPIKVDWGNGSSTDYTIGTYTSSISGTLTGNTIKIYGVGINYLYLYNRNLTSLDVTKNTTLAYLDCRSNQLTVLDVSNNTALTSLDCSSNQLTAIDVSKNNELTSFNCGHNQLTSLDVTNNTALTYFGCSSNQITALDVTKNTTLTHLECNSNQLTALDVTNNTALTDLDCNSNQLTFSTLPTKQTTWTTYIYRPQSVIALPKKQYGLTETVDLSSELTINSNNTNYTWKTKGGATLVAGTDYNVTGGVTTFLKVQTDSVYCQMTNSTFPDLTLTTTNIKVSQFPLSVSEDEIAVKVYPNPATESFNLEMAEEIVRVEVYTITGVKVFENGLYNSTKVTVPLNKMPKGTLLVKVFTRNGTYKSKVVKI